MTMQPSLKTMKTVTACEEALHLKDIERGHAGVARERRRGSKVRGKKVEVLRFLRPSQLRRLITRVLACHSKWRGCSQSLTVLGSIGRSLFG